MSGDQVIEEADAPDAPAGRAGASHEAAILRREGVGGPAPFFDFDLAELLEFDLVEPFADAEVAVAAVPEVLISDGRSEGPLSAVTEETPPSAQGDGSKSSPVFGPEAEGKHAAGPVVETAPVVDPPRSLDTDAGVDPAIAPEVDDAAEFAAEVALDDTRQRLVRQFEAWLDRMSQGEPPPEGLPEELLDDAIETPEHGDELASDLYTLFAALTKLSGEIGLQGRSFKQLTDSLSPLSQLPGKVDRIEAVQGAVARELAQRIESVQGAVAREIARLAKPDEADSELPTAKDVLAVLFDLYDRLNRGLLTFDASVEVMPLPPVSEPQPVPRSLLQRLLGPLNRFDKVTGGSFGASKSDGFGDVSADGPDKSTAGGQGAAREPAGQPAAPAEAMREGYRLTLSRLEAALRQWGIKRIGEVGEAFDPRHMAAIEVETAADVPDGSVLEVYRSGYMLGGRVLETARVKVSRTK